VLDRVSVISHLVCMDYSHQYNIALKQLLNSSSERADDAALRPALPVLKVALYELHVRQHFPRAAIAALNFCVCKCDSEVYKKSFVPRCLFGYM